MGVNIFEIIPKEYISLDDLKNKKIAVDSSNMIYQFLSSIRQQDGTPLMDEKRRITSHLQGILARVTNLMEKDMKLAFVFDGKSPLLKVKEQEDREYRKQQAEKKLKIAREEANEEEMLKYSKQTIRLNDDIIKESKELLSCLGMPIIQAPSEAEAQCSLINKNNDVYCVASSDADCILFGAPRLIKNLTL